MCVIVDNAAIVNDVHTSHLINIIYIYRFIWILDKSAYNIDAVLCGKKNKNPAI